MLSTSFVARPPGRVLSIVRTAIALPLSRIAAEHRRFKAIRSHRRDLDDLMQASEHTLRDIGVSRDEVHRQRIATRIWL